MLDNNLNNIFCFLFYSYIFDQNLSLLALKKNLKNAIFDTLFWHKKLEEFFSLFFSVFWGSLGVYIKKLGYLCPTRPEIKIGADGGHFSEVPRLRKEILTIWLRILLLGNYKILIFKLEPATNYIREENGKKVWFVKKKTLTPCSPPKIKNFEIFFSSMC